jgi:pSer/pThr/pTyr-binding forkhead associated (FHA) protein
VNEGRQAIRVDRPIFLIGRRRGADLVLADDGVSGAHATVVAHAGRRFLKDLSSRTGTWVNGVRVYETEIRSGDVIQIGRNQLRLELVTAEELAETLETSRGAASPCADSTVFGEVVVEPSAAMPRQPQPAVARASTATGRPVGSAPKSTKTHVRVRRFAGRGAGLQVCSFVAGEDGVATLGSVAPQNAILEPPIVRLSGAELLGDIGEETEFNFVDVTFRRPRAVAAKGQTANTAKKPTPATAANVTPRAGKTAQKPASKASPPPPVKRKTSEAADSKGLQGWGPLARATADSKLLARGAQLRYGIQRSASARLAALPAGKSPALLEGPTTTGQPAAMSVLDATAGTAKRGLIGAIIGPMRRLLGRSTAPDVSCIGITR